MPYRLHTEPHAGRAAASKRKTGQLRKAKAVRPSIGDGDVAILLGAIAAIGTSRKRSALQTVARALLEARRNRETNRRN